MARSQVACAFPPMIPYRHHRSTAREKQSRIGEKRQRKRKEREEGWGEEEEGEREKNGRVDNVGRNEESGTKQEGERRSYENYHPSINLKGMVSSPSLTDKQIIDHFKIMLRIFGYFMLEILEKGMKGI